MIEDSNNKIAENRISNSRGRTEDRYEFEGLQQYVFGFDLIGGIMTT